MNELDRKQAQILESWRNGEAVIRLGGGEVCMEHAMMSAVTGTISKAIARYLFRGDAHLVGNILFHAVTREARELAAWNMGYPYLQDAEAAMEEFEK